MRRIGIVIGVVLMTFVLPAALFAGWWVVQDHPMGWRHADWSASGLLPGAAADRQAAVYVLAARTGGLKGALSVHSWIVIKEPDGAYERYDKVGWGPPVRRDGWPADGFWYSNRPFVVGSARGARAEFLIPALRAAIAAYPHARNGDYVIWPGPNSNSFVSHVARAVPELGVVLPPNAVGRDYRPGLLAFDHSADWREWSLTLGGYAGVNIGWRSGFEVHLLGLVAGLDIRRPALKLPGFGRIGLWPTAAQSSRVSPAIEKPPSTTSVWPVTEAASAESR